MKGLFTVFVALLFVLMAVPAMAIAHADEAHGFASPLLALSVVAQSVSMIDVEHSRGYPSQVKKGYHDIVVLIKDTDHGGRSMIASARPVVYKIDRAMNAHARDRPAFVLLC